ncbi:MAG: isoprenylcysteine carboxylmethyltransferase family protein [Planctomycetes bacterium]|nr:isoprenylcysteine carboxylmethyltransferase family protein [Planctomycetota bacterium]
MRRRALALGIGLTTHLTFLVAVSAMFLALYDGLAFGRGTLRGAAALAANALLALQFPLLHSFLLTARGRAGMARLFGRHGARLAPTTYAWSAALQILVTFLLWSPSGIVWWQPQGAWLVASTVLFFGAWLFLGLALRDGGLGLQTGWIGWTALWRDGRVNFPPLPQAGLFAVCRQPIYLGFALTLWTGPVWTPDRLLLATIWTTYCVLGPRHKERRYLRQYGEDFARYQRSVPYLLPGRRRAA